MQTLLRTDGYRSLKQFRAAYGELGDAIPMPRILHPRRAICGFGRFGKRHSREGFGPKGQLIKVQAIIRPKRRTPYRLHAR